MKKQIFGVFLLILLVVFLTPKKLIISNSVKIIKDAVIERSIVSLSDLEIYQPIYIQVIDDFLIAGNMKPIEIVKLDLKGKVLIRNGNEGRGPGEFRTCLSPVKTKNLIAFLDIMNKIVFYDMNMKYVKELKLPKMSRDILVLKNNNFIFTESARTGFYLSRYSSDGKLLNRFGIKKRIFDPKDEFSTFDRARLLAFDETRNLIWCDNLWKYELRSFQKDVEVNLIRPKNEIFSECFSDYENFAEKIADIDTKSIRLICKNDTLFYFYSKKDILYVDIFDLKNLSHIKRVQLKYSYVLISYIKKNNFFGITYDEEGEPFLYEIEIKTSL